MQITLTNRESDLMDVLWEHGASTVAEVKDHLQDELAYTTVLTILRTLESKGYVRHEAEGRTHRYVPLVEREAARRSALQHLSAKFFKGSAELLMTHLVSNEKLTAPQLKRIRQLLDQRKGKGRT